MKHDTLITAYMEKVDAKIHEAKSKLDELEAYAKGKKAQAEIDAIVALRTKKKEAEVGKLGVRLKGRSQSAAKGRALSA